MRHEVFCVEQGVSREVEHDGLDRLATHIVGVVDGELVATCRLFFEPEGVCRLGRMAVARHARRGGAGASLMAAAEAEAAARSSAAIVLHAQRQAEPFYARLGFVGEGEPFREQGIPHVQMRKPVG